MSGTAADLPEPAGPIPDFCSPTAVLAVVLIAVMLALVLTLASHGVAAGFLIALSGRAMFVLWVGLASALLLCKARAWLAGLGPVRGLLIGFVCLQLVTLTISEFAWWLHSAVLAGSLLVGSHSAFLVQNLTISAIVWALTLRYFYVAGEWRRNVELESRAQIRALQARIRPHFLFNSMNTIAALTRRDPARAEEAIEDLADLFRATLGTGEQRIPLKEELEVARIYQRMEQLRLGERLRVDWDLDGVPLRALIPGLTVQPLLENAIYHGIEPLADGGTVHVHGRLDGDGRIELSVTNPVPEASYTAAHRGNRVALDNIRQRFDLAYGRRAGVDVDAGPGQYRVTLTFPADLP